MTPRRLTEARTVWRQCRRQALEHFASPAGGPHYRAQRALALPRVWLSREVPVTATVQTFTFVHEVYDRPQPNGTFPRRVTCDGVLIEELPPL